MTDEPTNYIFHIASAANWEQAQRDGDYRWSSRGVHLDDAGFIHAAFEHQVAEVGATYYSDITEPHVVLVIDPDLVGSPVVVENFEMHPDGYPHIYGPLPIAAVVEVRPFP